MPELDKLIRLSDLFGFSLDELARGETCPPDAVAPPQILGRVSWTQKVARLYRDKAYLLGWLLAAWGLLDICNSAGTAVGCYFQMGWEDTLRFLKVMSYVYILHALKLGLGLFIVFGGRRFAGRFRWYHLGWGLVILGSFGFRPVRFLRFGLLETLLTGFLLFLPYRGFNPMAEYFSHWPEDIGSLLLCVLGLLIVTLGRRKTEQKNPRS